MMQFQLETNVHQVEVNVGINALVHAILLLPDLVLLDLVPQALVLLALMPLALAL